MFFRACLFATVSALLSLCAAAKSITIATGLPKPPFILNEKNGLQIELIRSALNSADYNVTFQSIPLNRNISALQRYDVAGIALMPQGLEVEGIFLSKPYITYQNVAVSLAHNKLKIESLDDLSGKSVVAFQNAHKFLGKAYQEQTQYSLEYREVADQRKQIKLLENGSTEVIVLDLNILRYFLQSHSKLVDQILIHSIFPQNHYKAAFNDKKLARAFDRGIERLRSSGDYQRILDKYTGSKAYF